MNRLTPTIGQTYNTIEIDGVSIFYREAGSPDDPTILLLHGFPTSSFMYRDLIPALADEYHLIAPDYPGFGYSEQPPLDEFDYSFEHFTELMDTFTQELGLTEYSPYVMDYGAPVGFRLASNHPERVQALLVQNGNAYEEGLVPEFWAPVKEYWANPSEETLEPLRGFTSPEEVEWQYTHGVRNEAAISPDTWTLDRVHLDRPENESIQFELLLDYRTNLSLYPDWQEYFREHQPPALVVWGKHDEIFDVAGAAPYAEDLETAEIHRLDTGHFALEEDSEKIATLIREFLADHITAD